jgi:hypothetical protein
MRILVAIKSFLTEHTLFPVQFKFDGKDQLVGLTTEARLYAKHCLKDQAREEEECHINLVTH